jgi:hypothetical protein
MLVNLNLVTTSCLNPAHGSQSEGCEKLFHMVEAGQ